MNASDREPECLSVDPDRLRDLVAAGLTISEIAEAIGRCPATAKKWLNRYGLHTQRSRGAREFPGQDEATIDRVCRRHGLTTFARGSDAYFRCRRCRVESVVRRRRRVKELLAQEAGGCCVICGYSRYAGALQFHHLDPDQKRLGMSRGGVTLAVEQLRAEAAKCVLLCANRHAEVEAGLASVPIQ